MNTNDVDVLKGIPLYHSQDKREVCHLGKPTTKGYNMITLIYTGEPQRIRRIGIFNSPNFTMLNNVTLLPFV